MILTAVILGWIGLCVGSFVGALVWRLRKGKDWVKARSQCEHCGHVLSAIDLIPVASWLALRGRCRYCRAPIGAGTLAIELAGGLVFSLSYLYWPQPLLNGQLVLLVTWLAASIGLLALLVYDLRWMLLPNKIIYPTLGVAAAGRIVYLAGFEQFKLHALLWWALSVVVASGIFFLLFMVSDGKWIGYGDVRLGLITGTLLANPALSLLMIFLASVLGTAFSLPAIAFGRQKMTGRLPFGPFLITATAITLLFGSSIIHWYSQCFVR